MRSVRALRPERLSRPPPYRATQEVLTQIPQSVGSFVGNFIDYGTADRPDRSSYIIPLGTVHIIPGILSIALFFLPESPRWLAARGQTAQAEKSLTWLRPGPANWSVAAELAEMEAALAAEAQLNSSIGFMDLFRHPVDRRRSAIAILGLTTQAASGAMFLICKFLLLSP